MFNKVNIEYYGSMTPITQVSSITAPEAPLAPPGARRLQRLAAYALVVDAGHLLLTQLSERVAGGAGRWTLPGGGVDPGEAPVDGAVREVHEEAGQVVVVDELAAALDDLSGQVRDGQEQ